jgi:hypothetical protein
MTAIKRIAAAGVAVASALAVAASAWGLSLSTYTGHTSQHKSITIAARDGHVNVDVTFLCNGGGGPFRDSTRVTDIPLMSDGSFDGQNRTFRNSIGGGAYYVHGKFKKLKGHVTGSTSKGKFDVHANVFASDGEPYSFCDTGLVTWTASKS